MLKFLNGHDVNGLVLVNTITDSSIHNCFYETQGKDVLWNNIEDRSLLPTCVSNMRKKVQIICRFLTL